MGYTVYCINSYSTARNLPKVNDLPVDLVAQLTQEWEMSGEANCRKKGGIVDCMWTDKLDFVGQLPGKLVGCKSHWKTFEQS